MPLLMRGPGIPRGVNVDDLAINADLAPTIVDAANASPGLAMDGRSLIPVAQNPGIAQGRRLLLEQPPHYQTWPNVPDFTAIRTARYLYAEHGNGEKELYDLVNDPFELHSRHNDPAYASIRGQLATAPARAGKLRRVQLPHALSLRAAATGLDSRTLPPPSPRSGAPGR